MEEERKKRCGNCSNYGEYYTKGSFRFNKTHTGSCSIKHKIVGNQDCCGLWMYNYNKLRRRKMSAEKALNEILDNIAAIRQILEEEQNKEIL